MSLITFIKAEERLSWFTTDPEIKRSIFVPDNLSEGKEENRILPWVFHNDEKEKVMELKCIMRGYNVSNNPSDYQDARWSHPGFEDHQVDRSTPAVKFQENGEPYAIWTIKINTSAADAGIKRTTCEFQQGDFPLSTDFIFLIFRIVKGEDKQQIQYSLGENFDEEIINTQIEDDIKRQISEHYKVESSRVTRSQDGQEFIIPFNATTSTTTTLTNTTTCTFTTETTTTTTTITTTTTTSRWTTESTTIGATKSTTTTTKTPTTTTIYNKSK